MCVHRVKYKCLIIRFAFTQIYEYNKKIKYVFILKRGKSSAFLLVSSRSSLSFIRVSS